MPSLIDIFSLDFTEDERVYLRHIYGLADKHGIKIEIRPSTSVKPCKGQFTNGFFDDTMIVVAGNKSLEDLFPIFVHEACHMKQFLFKPETEEMIRLPLKHNGALGAIDSWLANTTEFTSKTLEKHLITAMRFEHNCEKMVLSDIRKYKLRINAEEYAQDANAYLFLYLALPRTRKWPNTPSIDIKKLRNLFPTKLMTIKELLKFDKIDEYLKYRFG